jgi:hypothetical protein
MTDPLSLDLAQVTVRDYVCSTCWGHLLMYPADGDKWNVLCHKCMTNTKGYVTRVFAQLRIDESRMERVEVERTLKEIGVMEKGEKRTEEQILKELGF